MIRLAGWRNVSALLVLIAATGITLSAQTFTTLHSFNGTDGANPYAGMTQGADGSLYGTTIDGGAYSSGNIIRISPNGALTSLYDFCSQSNCTDGQYPVSTLVLGGDGSFYGTTQNGGVYNPLYGTVYKISPQGFFTTLHSFNATDGVSPYGSLVQASNGNFYGTTTEGGACTSTGGCGTIFMMTPSGALTTLHNFCLASGCPDGQFPGGGLIEGTDGNIYGTARAGGNFTCAVDGCGTIFKITPSGAFSTLHVFAKADGAYPTPGLIEGAKGVFYGTTTSGGSKGSGTFFSVTSSGRLSTLYTFDGTDSAVPSALAAGSDGNFYGTTTGGGTGGQGTIFQITPTGTLTTLYSFSGTFFYYLGGLTQGTNGTFYGTTYFGGANNDGSIYTLSTGLKPFVSVQPRSGVVGATVSILGNNLTSATSVTFHGTPATFHVVSKNLITATVPTGATSGRVEVTSSNHSLLSSVPFVVAP